MAYKLIAFDMDGTLLDERKQIPCCALDALWAAQDRGCILVPATGRMLGSLPEPLEGDRIRYYILINGAMVYDRQEGRILYESYLSPDSALALCRWLDELPVSYDCYMENRGYMDAEMFDTLEPYFEKAKNMLVYVRSIRTRVPKLSAFIQEQQKPIQKMQVYFRPEQEALRQQLLLEIPRRFPELCATSSLPNNIEINSRGADKGKGLEALCRALGLPLSQSIAFGDGSNDIQMLRAAGLGVAMENGEAAVKAAADAIAPSNDRAGLGIFLEKLIAEGQL